MNSHQRRKASRRRHMLLPLGKEVRVGGLLGRRVYAYGRFGYDFTIYADDLEKIVTASVHRHVNPNIGGKIDLKLKTRDGREQIICTSMRGLRLKNPKDRAPRPFWVAMFRRVKGGAND